MKEFYASIVASDHVFYEGFCESMIIPTPDGKYGVKAGHSNLITAMIPGELKYRVPGGEMVSAIVTEGIVKITGSAVLVMADAVERPEDMDGLIARRQAEDEREAALQKKSIQEYQLAQTQLARAIHRLSQKGRGESINRL